MNLSVKITDHISADANATRYRFFSNIEFNKYDTTAGGGIQTLYPNQHTTKPASISTTSTTGTFTAQQVTSPSDFGDHPRKNNRASGKISENPVTDPADAKHAQP